MAARGAVDDRAQFGMDRNCQLDPGGLFGLPPNPVQNFVLASDASDGAAVTLMHIKFRACERVTDAPWQAGRTIICGSRTYTPRNVGDKVMMPADLMRLHPRLLRKPGLFFRQGAD